VLLAPHRSLWRWHLDPPLVTQLNDLGYVELFFEELEGATAEAYTQQGTIRRLHPDWAARPALMRRAAHAVESKAVVRIEVAVSPRPCLGCAVELVLRAAPLRRFFSLSFWVEGAYTQQGRAHIRRLHPDWAARPALMRRAAHDGKNFCSTHLASPSGGAER
jgi:hypothetical protein